MRMKFRISLKTVTMLIMWLILRNRKVSKVWRIRIRALAAHAANVPTARWVSVGFKLGT